MEQLIAGSFLALFALEFLVEFTLNELNLRHVRARWAARDIPGSFRAKIQSADYDRSVHYTLAKGRFHRWTDLYARALLLAVLFTGLLPLLDAFASTLANRFFPVARTRGIIFCLAVGAIFSIAGLPADLYATFGLEARFGFNKTTVRLYVADKLKGLLLGLVIGVPFLFVILWLMEVMGRYWWIWTFVFISCFELLMIVIYPTFISSSH
jgi:STE24 endopeptidase